MSFNNPNTYATRMTFARSCCVMPLYRTTRLFLCLMCLKIYFTPILPSVDSPDPPPPQKSAQRGIIDDYFFFFSNVCYQRIYYIGTRSEVLCRIELNSSDMCWRWPIIDVCSLKKVSTVYRSLYSLKIYSFKLSFNIEKYF